MPAGRPPKPTAAKELEGNPGKRPLPEHEPKPPAEMPPMPVGMPAEAEHCWELLAPKLHRAGMLTELDAHALESYCVLYAHCRTCWERAREQGVLVANGGRVEVNPYIREARTAEVQLHKVRSELGLNPTSRTRIDARPAEAGDGLEEGFLRFPA